MAPASNNPPAAVIELSQEQAEILMESCEANIRVAIGAMNGLVKDRSTLEALVRNTEVFKVIHASLKKQGF